MKTFLAWLKARLGEIILFAGLILIFSAVVWLSGAGGLLARYTALLCTALALAVSMVLSSVAGTAIPIFFKWLKVDPAVASGPLITTVNDLVAVISYYALAWLLMIRLPIF